MEIFAAEAGLSTAYLLLVCVNVSHFHGSSAEGVKWEQRV